MATRFRQWALVVLLLAGVPGRVAHAQILRGTVREDPSGDPVTGVVVRLLDGQERALDETLSDDDGRFLFRLPGPGSYRVSASRMGYATTTSDLLIVEPGSDAPLEIFLTVEPVPLDPLEVVGEPRALRVPQLERVGFYRRMEIGFGHYILKEEIERRSPARVTDLFYGIPGARLVRHGSVGDDYTLILRACPITTVVLDGIRLTGGLNEAVHPAEIEAIEVYPGPAGVPPQYSGLRSMCGAILIWTRQ